MVYHGICIYDKRKLNFKSSENSINDVKNNENTADPSKLEATQVNICHAYHITKTYLVYSLAKMQIPKCKQ